MTIVDGALIGIAAVMAGLSMHPKIRKNMWWGATVTPLASIIGSGFLVVAPLLAAVAGAYALSAMGLIVVLAYAIGQSIRYNIKHAEPLEGRHTTPVWFKAAGKTASAALSVAYVISVAFYIRLLASFALSLTPFNDNFSENVLATAILLMIAGVGFMRGLRGLEVIETISVSIKLSIIVALLVGLVWYNSDTGIWAADLVPESNDIWTRLRMLAGMLLVVQGFETSRYLGSYYSAEMRRKTMNIAQISSGVIYLAFVALVVPVLVDLPVGPPEETAIIDIMGRVAPVLPYLLVLAALMSQLSAGIADTVGAGGLVVQESAGRIVERHAYPVLIAFSIVLIWAYNIFEVISIASRTFAFYYMMQTVIAAMVARQYRHYGQMVFSMALSTLLALVVVFAIPAE